MGFVGDEDPAEIVSRAQRVRAVRTAVAGLSSRHRRAIALSLDGLGPAEIAQDFGIERNAADALLYRARRRLAESIRLDQIGVAIALAFSRLRASTRRSDLDAPLLSAAPAGMHIATGLVGLAMTASITLAPTTTATHTPPASPAVHIAATVTETGSLLGAARPATVAAQAAPAPPTRRNSVSLGTKVPGSSSGKNDVGLRVWRDHDGKGITGPTVERAANETCAAGACTVLR
jgi:DNA-binding CsgD family transcriptional regulator